MLQNGTHTDLQEILFNSTVQPHVNATELCDKCKLKCSRAMKEMKRCIGMKFRETHEK